MFKLEPSKISSTQLTFLLMAFILGTSTILPPGGTAAKNNVWLAIPVGMLEGLFFVWIYISLSKKYPDKTLVDINDAVYGPYLGKAVSILYILFFLHVAALVITNFFEFFSLTMPQTPPVVFSFWILLICAWTVKCGIEVMARTTIVTVPLVIITVLLDIFFIAPKMDLSNLLPMLDISALQFFKASHSAAVFPYSESVAFLMILGFLNKSEEAGKSFFTAFLLTAIIFAIVGIRNISVLGAKAQFSIFPSFGLIRLINMGDIITRVEIVAAVNLLAVGFIKAAVFYYGSVLGIAQMLKMKSYQPLVLPIGALILNLSLMTYENFPDSIQSAGELFPYYTLPFVFFLPLLTLIIASVRKNALKAE